jgi:wobble nucleotide-excising tRNase
MRYPRAGSHSEQPSRSCSLHLQRSPRKGGVCKALSRQWNQTHNACAAVPSRNGLLSGYSLALGMTGPDPVGIDRFQLLRNVGVFDSIDTGAQLPLGRFSLIYAENGRGKSTLAAILRSVGTGNPDPITERQRLGSPNPPHVVLSLDGRHLVFQNGQWSAYDQNIVVFDDEFIAANVCSGVQIHPEHRQSLHELILGARAVSLNATLEALISRIEGHNRVMRNHELNIPQSARGSLNIDAFCALSADPGIEGAIIAAERDLAAARGADGIRTHAAFSALRLPSLDLSAINTILSKTLADLETEAEARVRARFVSLGPGGEEWVDAGMMRIGYASKGHAHEVCPFCCQSLGSATIIPHYRAYFSEAYDALRTEIAETIRTINAVHGGEQTAAFERSVRIASEIATFWRSYADMPEVLLDTAAITASWVAARDAILIALRAKAAAPLDAMLLSEETRNLVDAHEGRRREVGDLSIALEARNPSITSVKGRTAGANISSLTSELARLKIVRARHSEPVAGICEQYLTESSAKTLTEIERTQARSELDNYRIGVFPAYEATVNRYLQRFNAGFRLGSVDPVNTRHGSSCTYNVVVNDVSVELTPDAGPSFRTALSSGDRSTLALAFFFASLDHDTRLARKVVVIDDPMTSLDEHRSMTTIQEVRRLLDRSNQIIVLSHSKPFLCSLWEGADSQDRCAIMVHRDGSGSTLANWDVNQDCRTENDRRHELVASYLQSANHATEREVAQSLRPILEVYMRVAYPAIFVPGSLLGPFIGTCEQRAGGPGQILNGADISELRELLDYVNLFHHDSNLGWRTARINDRELSQFCRRVLAFIRRT